MKIPEILSILAILVTNSLSIYIVNGTEKISTNPAVWTEEGIWGPLLEDWALTPNYREKRVMQLPPADDSYVMDDKIEEKEAKISPGKIVNSSSNPNKKPPGRQVSETDLYLLSAIEKLVYRVDFMEKRLRRVEEMLYFVMAGNRIDHEPCPENFVRAGTGCYAFWSAAGREMDWKAASKHCKRIGGTLAELDTVEENQDVIAHIMSNQHLKGKDYWTGGLNPGLLWIWSNSARPVAIPGATNNNNNSGNNKNPKGGILGDGRCLKLAYDPALRSYNYRGTDCGMRFSYICEMAENTSSNEIKKLGRSRKIFDEL